MKIKFSLQILMCTLPVPNFVEINSVFRDETCQQNPYYAFISFLCTFMMRNTYWHFPLHQMQWLYYHDLTLTCKNRAHHMKVRLKFVSHTCPVFTL